MSGAPSNLIPTILASGMGLRVPLEEEELKYNPVIENDAQAAGCVSEMTVSSGSSIRSSLRFCPRLPPSVFSYCPLQFWLYFALPDIDCFF